MKRAQTITNRNGQNGASDSRPRPELPPGTLRYLTAALKQQWKRYRKGLKRCQEKISPHAVHDFRVATRRLSSILALLSPLLPRAHYQKLHLCLKEYRDTFDDLRDTQVQLASVRKMLRAFPEAKPFYQHLKKREARLTRRTRKEVKDIRTKRLGKLLTACREDIKRSCRHSRPLKANTMLLKCINQAFAKTLELKNRIDAKVPETIHRTRVAFKRLRYMIETLAEHFPLADDKLLEAMHRYQTLMGDIQDAEVLRCSMDCFLEKKKIGPKAARRLRKELMVRRAALTRFYLQAADQLDGFWPKPVHVPRAKASLVHRHGALDTSAREVRRASLNLR